ncbi:MAG: 2-hydroxymuconate tautomerase family protein [Rhodobacteraceae bacterium]|jgi:4-oxalocrotonate tautomerase|nr:4-oxalocrotonate tautomerase [Paracoccaceae bacterium]MDB4219963.1 2-hydroxymuconate tautomerase family protein [bacterium]MBT4284129.1 2-hydroxymuconate tautomerase family protein [Paracoccaceae bacterium]MBT4777295.1 2-hydroxymuconate tautomerase family protein [Paracoccaceae bacterium]MBT6271702.1 2-hydroxymuconate tautomerase family protein [Paracoccaceae bacterium]
MPLIRVEMFKGRTDEQKKVLVKELTDSFIKSCGGNRDAVDVIITDIEQKNWGKAGELYSDKIDK